ncbi:MAG: universal stress protein [Methanomassiliicoccus sp.]|nr:universal stress protein [Methanomassiliicoccus sp.]
MGTIGRTGLAHLLLGSVAEKVIRFSACPVLVLHGRPQADGFAVHRILIPTDGSPNTEPAIRHGLLLAQTFQAEVTALSVGDVRNVPSSARGSGRIDQYLTEIGRNAVDHVAEEGRKLSVDVRTSIVTGSPSEEIIKASDHYDLVVMGTVGRTGLAHLRLGSVAERTARHARCPVLTVRAPRPAEPMQ